MHAVHLSDFYPYAPELLFDLVLDVESYPEFLPWCKAARILEYGDGDLLAELLVSFKGFETSYVSKVVFDRPDSIVVEQYSGPFRSLNTQWMFLPEGEGTRLSFELSFAFKQPLLNMLMGRTFERAQEKMVRAFAERLAAGV